MPNDILREFIETRVAVERERDQIERRLAEIKRALGETVAAPLVPSTPVSTTAGDVGSLRDVVLKVTAGQTLNRHEIVDAVQAAGYRFKTSKPLNSLGVLLYNKKLFRNEGGRFTPAATARPTKAAKRKMSAEGRARIAAAARKRWAKVRASKKAKSS